MSSSLDKLRDSAKELLSEKRFKHTIGVERCAEFLGSFLLHDRLDELRAAAILHDIAKELDVKQQLSLIDEYAVDISDEDRSTLPALHSFAAVAIILRDFADFATSDILSAVKNHTLGAKEMSLFEKIIYISDFIEEGRTYSNCKLVREYLLGGISSAKSNEEAIALLNNAIVMSIDFTISALNSNGYSVNSRTLAFKESLLP